ncbi:hypothetical protein DUNSADRAFT_8379 [Dunaliella salina]|uniref:C2H2-type domain-containing protein n=1 Tax=Dunaliella salina TaxID=3046 RepID=A0ABQ7GJS4_DUNSA|nr:hypothetical protein DUNSADRAFT_8379 [Dunaliella salina]|eukprot:KAF5834839.1 hypothetical protein DUNSADRAFT_8379 [Dunaliella salina]
MVPKPSWVSLLKRGPKKEQPQDDAPAGPVGPTSAAAVATDKGRSQESNCKDESSPWVQVATRKQHATNPSPQPPASKPGDAPPASSHVLFQAHKSPLEATGKVRCRACGQAFPTYTSLAQHLSSKHAGINSEDVKFMQLRGLVGSAGTSGRETGASPQPSKRGRAQEGVNLADLFAGPSLQEAAAASRAGAAPSAAFLKQKSERGKAAAKSSGTTLSFGSLLGRAATAKSGPAITKGKGGKAGSSQQQLKQHGVLPRRGKLRWENAEKKQRLSHVKRLVLQERAARGLFAAEQMLSKACNSRAEVVAHQARLMAEMQASAQEAGIPLPIVPGPCSDQLVAPGAQASPAPKLPSLLPPQMPASVRAATLQLALQQVAKRLSAAQRMVETATRDMAAAQQQHAKALRLPIPAEDPAPGHTRSGDDTSPSKMLSVPPEQEEQWAATTSSPSNGNDARDVGMQTGGHDEADAMRSQQQNGHVQQQQQQHQWQRQQEEERGQQQREQQQRVQLQGGDSDNDSSNDEDSSDSSDDDGSEPGPFKDLLSQWAANSKVPVGFGKLLKRSNKPTSQPANPFASFKAASKDAPPAAPKHDVSSSSGSNGGSNAARSTALPLSAAAAPQSQPAGPLPNAPSPPTASQQNGQNGVPNVATKPQALPFSTTNLPSSSGAASAATAAAGPFAPYQLEPWSAPPSLATPGSQPRQLRPTSTPSLLNLEPSPRSTAAVFHSSPSASAAAARRSSTGEQSVCSSGFADLRSYLQSQGSTHSQGPSFFQGPPHSHSSVDSATKTTPSSVGGGVSLKGLQARLVPLEGGASVLPHASNTGGLGPHSPHHSVLLGGAAGGGSLAHGSPARTSSGTSAVHREGNRQEFYSEYAPAPPHSQASIQQQQVQQQQHQPAGLASLTAQLHNLQLQQQHQSSFAYQGPTTQVVGGKDAKDKQAQLQYISQLQRQLHLAQQQQQQQQNAPAGKEHLQGQSAGLSADTPSASQPLSGIQGPTSTPATMAYYPSQSHQQGPPPAQRPNSRQEVPPTGTSSAQWTNSAPHSLGSIAESGSRAQSAPVGDGQQTPDAFPGALTAAELESLLQHHHDHHHHHHHHHHRNPQQQQQQQQHSPHPQQPPLSGGTDRTSMGSGLDRCVSVPMGTSYSLSSPVFGAPHSSQLMHQQDIQPHTISTVPAASLLHQHSQPQPNSQAFSPQPPSSAQSILVHRRDSAGGMGGAAGGASGDAPPKPKTFRSAQQPPVSGVMGDFMALHPADLLQQRHHHPHSQSQQPQFLPLQQSIEFGGGSKAGVLGAGPGSEPNLGATPSPQVSPPQSAPNLGVGTPNVAATAAAPGNPAAAVGRRPTSRADVAAYLALGRMPLQLPVYRSSRGKGSEGAQQQPQRQPHAAPLPPPQLPQPSPQPHLPAPHVPLMHSMAAPPPQQQQPMPLISMPMPAMSMGVGSGGAAGGAGGCGFMVAPDQAYLVADQGTGLGPVYAYQPLSMPPPGQQHVGMEHMHPAAMPAGYAMAPGYPHPAGMLVQPHMQPVQLQPPHGQVDLHGWQQMQLQPQLHMSVPGYELGGLHGPESGGGISAGSGSDELGCTLCGVKCNSRTTLDQHLSSRKHLAKVAKQALAVLDAAERALPSSASSRALPLTYVGPGANTHGLCRQIITPDLNQVVSELLLRIKGFQDRAMARDPIKAAAHRWFVCGLREVRKVLRLRKARLVIAAPNIEGVSADGGLDEFLGDILAMCEVQNVASVFALTRKKMGEIYGARKRVSAVALLELNGVDDLVGQVLDLAEEGKVLWNAAIEEEQEQQQQQQQQQQQGESQPQQPQQPSPHYVAQPGVPAYAQEKQYVAPSVPQYAQPGVAQYAPAEQEVFAGHMEMPQFEPQQLGVGQY